MPGAHPYPHDAILERSLISLGVDPPQLLSYDVVSGGGSGAHTYRLRTSLGDLVLKVTLPGSPDHLRERACRELLFYRRLASEARVRVPTMTASHCEDAAGTCLLFTAYQPAPAPAAWTETRFVEAAEQLGRLHAAFQGRERELATLGWLRRDTGRVATDIHRATAHWRRLSAEGRFAAILPPKRLASVLRLLQRVDDLETGESRIPITLCHGDFHVDNTLLEHDGKLVLADWQEVGLGRGPEDLAFFIQRAEFAGGVVPVKGMFDAYRRSLVANSAREVGMRDICQVAEAAELRMRLLHWPAFLIEASARQLTDMLDRIQVLAGVLTARRRQAVSGHPGRVGTPGDGRK